MKLYGVILGSFWPKKGLKGQVGRQVKIEKTLNRPLQANILIFRDCESDSLSDTALRIGFLRNSMGDPKGCYLAINTKYLEVLAIYLVIYIE